MLLFNNYISTQSEIDFLQLCEKEIFLIVIEDCKCISSDYLKVTVSRNGKGINWGIK